MPIRKEDYPPDWAAISIQVREAAGQRCQWCGVPNGATVQRIAPVQYRQVWIAGVLHQKPAADWLEAPTGTRIILTVAHLDRDCTNNDRSNLAALCQRCHLNHDRAAQHIPNRRYGRHHDREQQAKLDLLGD